jgi:branched-chain amino acid aminotransferase
MITQTAITTAILTPRGLQRTAYRAASLNDAAKYEPQGVYTVSRTFRRVCALELAAHLDRLEESARLKNIPLRLERSTLRAALHRLIDEAGYSESRFRITIPAARPDSVYFAIEPLEEIPAEIRVKGVRVRSFPVQRSNPQAKDTTWMALRSELRAQMTDGIYEGLLTSPDGLILEGLGSNFYAVLDGELRTARTGMLHGIGRRVMLTVAPKVLPVREEPVALADIPRLSEALMTSSSRGVIPIVEIDGQRIGSGQPGPLTRAIEARYNDWAESHLEPI